MSSYKILQDISNVFQTELDLAQSNLEKAKKSEALNFPGFIEPNETVFNFYKKTYEFYIKSLFYEDIEDEKEVIRVFECDDDLGIEELWHQDNEDRIIEIIGETDWKIQLYNQLPTSMNVPIFIPKHMWHRAIKGTGNLRLKIHKS